MKLSKANNFLCCRIGFAFIIIFITFMLIPNCAQANKWLTVETEPDDADGGIWGWISGSGNSFGSSGIFRTNNWSRVYLWAWDANGCEFVRWEGIDGYDQSWGAYYVDMNNRNQTVTAIFNCGPAVVYNISASAGNGGTISPDGVTQVNEGVSQSYTISPDSGYCIDDVLVDGNSEGEISSFSFVDIDSDHTISAQFRAHSFTGYVSPVEARDDGGQWQLCDGAACSGWQNNSTTLNDLECATNTFTLQCKDISGWTRQFEAAQITLPGDSAWTCVYDPIIEYTITASVSPDSSYGSISPEGDVTVVEGADQTFTLTPNDGYEISDVIVDGNSEGALSDYTFLAVAADHTITAVFVLTDPSDIDDDVDGFTENEGDCDDNNADIHPNAQEICGNAVDEDCDGFAPSCSGDCMDIADSPLDAQLQPDPANIALVLDDSGSMDWEVMTNETDGKFKDGGAASTTYTYVFPNPGDHVYSSSSSNGKILQSSSSDKTRWRARWSGYNFMYYNPEVTYIPWPGRNDADTTNPRSNPMLSNYTLDLTDTYMTITSGGEYVQFSGYSYSASNYCADAVKFVKNGNEYIIDSESSNNFSKSSGWSENSSTPSWGPVGSHYWYNNDSNDNLWAKWMAAVPEAGTYQVWVDWISNSSRRDNAMYQIFYDGGSQVTVGPFDQSESQGWNQIHSGLYFSGSSTVNVKNAHYFVWSETEGKAYLINLDGDIDYYRFTDSDGDKKVDDGELQFVLTPPADVATDRVYADEIQNFANWYSFYRRRELTATAAVSRVLDDLQGVMVGLRSINGDLVLPMKPVRVGAQDDTADILDEIYQWGVELDENSTPLRKGFAQVARYFDRDHYQSNQSSSVCELCTLGPCPIQNTAGAACQQNFVILFTDGYYNGSDPDFSNYDGDNGAPYADDYSDTLADIAMKYYEEDLAADVTNLVPTNFQDKATYQHVVTYSVTFGVHGSLDPADYDLYNIEPAERVYPTWPDPEDGNQYRIDDLWHASVNGRGLFLSADNPQDLIEAFHAAISNINSRIGSGASVSINGEELHAGMLLFQSRYSTDGWTGDVVAYPLDETSGAVMLDQQAWSAADELEDDDWSADRHIITYNGTAGIPFRFNQLESWQEDALDNDPVAAENKLNYLRGDRSQEIVNGGAYRSRVSVLGDIVHSAPLFVPDYYAHAFADSGVIFSGANDGMLHAFDSATGKEIFAYIPALVFSNLSALTVDPYLHQYYVDLTPYAKEVNVTIGGDTYGTLLVGGLGKGGHGYYCLDVTAIRFLTTETEFAGRILWEYPNGGSTPVAETADMGYSFSRAFIVKSCDVNHPWIVIFGNGYASTNGHAVLFVLDAITGDLLTRIDTMAGGCNGLSTPITVDVNNDYKVDYVYAGDLKGNMWKFDLTDNSAAQWDVAFSDASFQPQPLFQAIGPGGTTQPITSKPDVQYHCTEHGYIVVFGTGKYLAAGDYASTATQTIYGIWDFGDDADDSEYLGAFNRADAQKLSNQDAAVSLLAQTEVFYGAVGSNIFRVLSDNEPKWWTEADATEGQAPNPGPGNNGSNGQDDDGDGQVDEADEAIAHAGWYFDLPLSSERVVRDVMIRDGVAIIISSVPTMSACEAGGESILHEMNSCTGGRMHAAQMDINDDGEIDEKDLINIGTDDDPEWVPPTGWHFPEMIYPPKILWNQPAEIKYFSSSRANIVTSREEPESRRIYYWREVY